jgi:GT2 family glycosyltransferase
MGRTAIIMPTHNAMPQLAVTLRALAWAGARDEVSLVVADSASADETLEVLRELAPWAVVVHGDESWWWAAATNAGCAFADESLACDTFCLLNHDCLLDEPAFDRLLEEHRRHPGDIISSRVEIHGGTTVFFAGGTQSWTGMLTMRGLGEAASTKFPSGPLVWCGGMGVVVSAGLWRRLGGFDEVEFPHYHADADFCLRSRTAGARVRYCDEAQVLNDRSSTGLGVDFQNASLRRLLETLVSQKSPYWLPPAFTFYRRHEAFRWPLALAHLYGIHLGSGVKRIIQRELRERW